MRHKFKIFVFFFVGFLIVATLVCYFDSLTTFKEKKLFSSYNKEKFSKFFANFNSKEDDLEYPSKMLENHQQIYEYIVNVTQLSSTRYLQMLQYTLNETDYPSKMLVEEKDSLVTMIPNKLHIKHNKKIVINERTFSLPFLTAFANGRQGNVMGEYATLFALGQLYNVSVFLHPEMEERIKYIFPSISMKTLPPEIVKLHCTGIGHEDTGLYNYSPIEMAAAGLFGPKCFILNGYPCEMKLFNAVKKNIFKEFEFSPQIMKQATNFLSSITKKNSNDDFGNNEFYTYIGIHIRRSDYRYHLQQFGGKLPSISYLKRALHYYRSKYSNVIFIAASDDMSYVEEILGVESDVFFTEEKSPELDMAILTSCNHSIFTVGSFGFWSAYLTGGEVVYADIETNRPYRFSSSFYKKANLTNFIPIKYY